MTKEKIQIFNTLYEHAGSFKEIYPLLYKQVKEKGAKAGEVIMVKRGETIKEFRVIREKSPKSLRRRLIPKVVVTGEDEVYRKVSAITKTCYYT